MKKLFTNLIFVVVLHFSFAQDTTRNLIPPILLENEERLNGNSLATYVAMLNQEDAYLNSPLKRMYQEQKLNLEQFMGIPDAGIKAMDIIESGKTYTQDYHFSKNHLPKSALEVIVEKSTTHRVIIWGEEHHLPQTRILYKPLLEKLWDQGFRYLAAETFSAEVESEDIDVVTPSCGFYLMDPVYADAMNYAIKKGYTLISYDNNAPDRDKTQAETIKKKIFDQDPSAKVFIIAGRGHIAEYVQNDNWKPMAYWLKIMTGIDPLTLYAPTMTSRSNSSLQHPLYTEAVDRNLINEVTLFYDPQTKEFLGEANQFDAYLFFPPLEFEKGRSQYLFKELQRNAFKVSIENVEKSNFPVLIQAHNVGASESSVPIDQLLVNNFNKEAYLALPNGEHNIKIIDRFNNIISNFKVRIPE